MRSVKVELGERSYEVLVGPGLLDRAASLLPAAAYANVVLISDRTVDDLYGDRAQAALAPLGRVLRMPVAAGEDSKSLGVALPLLEQMAALRVRRQDLVVTLGGGVVSDLGGFVASIYQRGIDVIHLPTTLLGQVDAAIGGKTGVNLQAGKNLVGTFAQPRAVIADVGLLKTLPPRQFSSGLAEVIKYGLCYEQSILQTITERTAGVQACDPQVLEDMVGLSASIKARVVSQDEQDLGARNILNYGHTFGHALEAAGGYGTWLHGEAISVGMMFAAHIAHQMGILSDQGVSRHREALEAVGLPVTAGFDPRQVESAWSIDKKFRDGQRWVLLEGIGNPVLRCDVRPEHLQAALRKVSNGGRAL